MARLPLAVARDSEGSMQAWQVLARAGLADGDAAAPQAGAPRPLNNAADVLQLLEDAPSQPPAEPHYRSLNAGVAAKCRFFCVPAAGTHGPPPPRRGSR